MSRLLGIAVARWPTGELIEQGTGGIEQHGLAAWRLARFAARPAGGDRVDGAEYVAVTVVLDDGRRRAGLVDRDGDERAGEEALVELPRGAVDIECAIAANA